jgi:ABC-type Zn uptake system ZnuABC Zn-binding protein ZnuA
MKRMTVREFRSAFSKLAQEDREVEVVRYHETIGYFLTRERFEELTIKKPRKRT